MTKTTHSIAGVTTYLILSNSITPAGVAVSLVSSTLPDVDIKIPFIKHRGVTHSLFVLTALGSLAYFFYPGILMPFLAGYLSHLVLDTLTPMGIKWLWPYQKSFSLKLGKTGGILDKALRVTLAGITVFIIANKLIEMFI